MYHSVTNRNVKEADNIENTEKESIRERARKKIFGAKIAAGAMIAGVGATVATAGGAAAEGVAVEGTALANFAADLGMSVPSLLLFVCFVISFILTMGWIRSQYAYYTTAGLGVLWAIVHYLGL